MKWFYAFLPVIVTLLGAAWTTWRNPSDKLVGAVQHFAAGVVFFAAAGEILPDVIHTGSIWAVVLGGALGVGAMLLLRHVTERYEEGPIGLIAASAADALIDGMVLGLGFNAGAKQGLLLSIALAIEFLFLALSIAGAFARERSRWAVIASATGVSLAVPVGVALSLPLGRLPQTWQAVAFAFGLVALLYLVTEELLTEAHEKPETAWGTAAFFVGFLAMTVISEAMG